MTDGETVSVSQGDVSAKMALVIDDSIPNGSAWIPMAVQGVDQLGDAFGAIKVEKV